MPKSKHIDDYFEAKVSDLKPAEKIDFDIHLYFTANHHIMLWRSKDEVIAPEFLEKYRTRGVTKMWIHRDDLAAYQRYMNPARAAAANAQVQEAKAVAAEIAEKITETMQAPALPPAEKAAEVAALAQELVRQVTLPETQVAQKQTNQAVAQAVQQVINDILDTMLDQTRDRAKAQIKDLWKLSHIDPDLEHAVNVSTFAVIFAMAFGRIDAELLADIALAGLLHDIGLTQVSPFATIKPWRTFELADLQAYATHVNAGIALVDQLTPEASPRVKMLIQQHHEKFDGTGYPAGLDGFHVDDVAQLVVIADILDSFASGQWDGIVRTLKETFEMLEKLEKARTFPEFFNPEVFAAVIRWIRSTAAQAARAGALEVVEHQTVSVLGTKAS